MARLAYLLVLPAIGALVVVEGYPLAESLYLSVTNYSQGGAFVGAANYAQLVADPRFWGALGTSIVYAVGSTILAFALGILFAYEVTRFRGQGGLLEMILLMPLATAPIVVGILWSPSAIWDDINSFTHFILGLPYIDVTKYYIYFPIMTVSEAYEWAPILMLTSLSIIAGIPKGVYDAAALHGASPWQVFRKISLPAILSSPVTQFMIVIRLIDAMRAFEIPFTWSSWIGYPVAGSPVDTLGLYLFKLLTTPAYSFPIGYISAAAVALLVATLAVTVLLLRFMSRVVRF